MLCQNYSGLPPMSKISEGSYKHYQREELTSTLFDRDLLLRLFKYLKPYHTLIFISLCILIFSKAIEASIPILIGYLSQNILNTGFRDLFVFVSHLSLDAALIFFLLCLAYGLDSINVWIRS